MELTEDQKKQKRVVLDCFLHQGDEVIVMRDRSSSDHTYDTGLPPDGTRAFVVGHGTYFRHVTRGSRTGKAPGVYRHFGASVCMFEEDGKTVYRHLSPHSLIFADPSFDPQTCRREGTLEWEMSHSGVFVDKLPELPFCEGDIVELNVRFADQFPDGLAMIEDIDYDWARNCPVDRKPAIYRLTPVKGGFTMNLSEDEFRLKRRGLLFFYEDDPSQHEHFPYEDFLEQVRFYMQVDKTVQLKNPASGDYGWTVEEVEAALKEGKGALITGHIFSRTNSWAQRGRPPAGETLWFYDLPELPEIAAKCRAATLKAFGEPTDYRYNNEEPERAPLEL